MFGEPVDLVSAAEKTARSEKVEMMIRASDKIDLSYAKTWKELVRKNSGLPHDERELDVKEIIRARGGSIPIDKWMAHVLYGKDGYYSSGRAKINSGDFSTTVSSPQYVYNYMRLAYDNLRTRTIKPKLVSAASGGGDFDRNFLHVLKNLSQEGEFPKETKLYAVDYSINLLMQQKEKAGIVNEFDHFGYPPENISLDPVGGLHVEVDQISFDLTWQEVKQLFEGFDPRKRYVREVSKRDVIPDEVYEQLQRNFAKYKIERSKFECFRDTIRYAPLFFDLMLRKFSYVELEANKPKISSSVINMPFPSNSIDIIYSNELFDAIPAKGFWVDENGGIETINVGLNGPDDKFNIVRKPAGDQERQLVEAKIRCLKEMDVRAANAKYKGLITVNVDAAKFVVEAARVLSKGGIFIASDYVSSMDVYRFQEGDHFQSDVLDDIGNYDSPYGDVTLAMEPFFLKWVGYCYGFKTVADKSESELARDYADSLTYKTSGWKASDHNTLGGNWRVLALIKS